TLAVHVDSTRIVAGRGHLEDLGLARFRRIVAALQTNQVAGEIFRNTPDRVVDRARHHRVQRETDKSVELRVECGRGALALAVFAGSSGCGSRTGGVG